LAFQTPVSATPTALVGSFTYALTLHRPIKSATHSIRNHTILMLTDILNKVRVLAISMSSKIDSVWFTTKGQVVIPAWLRKQFQIEDGTRAIVQASPEGILLKPVTAVTIRRLRGIMKRKSGDAPLNEEWAEHKREETELEEAKYARSPSSR
jgi:AbrB family looped-hinge helix DNA binding protein